MLVIAQLAVARLPHVVVARIDLQVLHESIELRHRFAHQLGAGKDRVLTFHLEHSFQQGVH